jgi:hypothetical protein
VGPTSQGSRLAQGRANHSAGRHAALKETRANLIGVEALDSVSVIHNT